MLGNGFSVSAASSSAAAAFQDSAFTNDYSILFTGAATNATHLLVDQDASFEPTDDTEAWSWSFWMKSTRSSPGSHGDHEFVMDCATGDHPDGFRLYFPSSSTNVRLYFNSLDYDGSTDFVNKLYAYDYSSATGAADLRDGNWHHFAFMFKEGEPAKIWNDGSAVTLSSSAGNIPDGALNNFELDEDNDGNYDLHIGSNAANGKGYKGYLDELSVWRGELTNDIVTAIYNSGAPIALDSDSGNYTLADELVGWWRMEENTGTTVADSSSNSNTATLTNSPTFAAEVPS